MVPSIPDPTDVLRTTLLWLGVPALVLTPILSALAILAWWNLGRSVAALRHSRWPAIGPLSIAGVAISQAFLVATTYSAGRLISAMGIDDASGFSIADGRSFNWAELWLNLATYSRDSEIAVNLVLFAIGWALALDFAALFGIVQLHTILAMVRWPLTLLAALAAIGIGLVGLMVLSLATWMDDPQYNIEMVTLYAMWVVILVAFIVGLRVSISGSLRLMLRTAVRSSHY